MNTPATPLLAALESKKLLAQKELASKHTFAQKWLADKAIKKEIFVPNKIIHFVV